MGKRNHNLVQNSFHLQENNSETFLRYQESFKDLSNGSKVLPSRPVGKKGFERQFDRMIFFHRKKTFNIQ